MFKYKYQLRAISVHIGQAHSGHFITYRRGIGVQNRSTWYKTSDTEVNIVKVGEMPEKASYCVKFILEKHYFLFIQSETGRLI